MPPLLSQSFWLSALATRQITIHELSVANADIDMRLDAKGVESIGGFPMEFAEAADTIPSVTVDLKS